MGKIQKTNNQINQQVQHQESNFGTFSNISFGKYLYFKKQWT